MALGTLSLAAVCLSLAVTGCLGQDLLGSRQCADGPTFWCTSLDTAAQCNAYHFCSSQIWTGGAPPTPGTMSSQPGPAEQANVLKEVRAMELVVSPDEDVDAIYSMLEKLEVDLPADECDCEVCEYFTNLVNSWISANSTQEAIKGYYDKLCMNVPASMQEHCTDVVGKHVMVVFEDMGHLDPKKACKDWCSNIDTKARQQKFLPKLSVQDKPVNTCLCQVCQQVFTDIAQEFASKTEQQFVVTEWQRFCTFLPDAEVAQCNKTAGEYIPKLYSMMSHLDPARSCNRFKFCEPTKVETTPVTFVPTTKPKYHIPCIGPYFDLTKRNEDGSIPEEIMEVAQAVGLNSIPDDDCACESCKYAYGQFASCLHRNATRNFINSFYHKICLDVPPALQESCVDVVVNHFAELTLDLGHIDPDKACKRDCQQEAKITKVPLVDDSSLSVTNTCLCQRCQQYVQEFTTLAGQPSYQKEFVEGFVNFGCRFLSDNGAATKCKKEAEEYLPEMLKTFTNLDPVRTCSHFKYCKKPE